MTIALPNNKEFTIYAISELDAWRVRVDFIIEAKETGERIADKGHVVDYTELFQAGVIKDCRLANAFKALEENGQGLERYIAKRLMLALALPRNGRRD